MPTLLPAWDFASSAFLWAHTARCAAPLGHRYKDSKGRQAKLKTPGQLQELLDITRDLLAVGVGAAGVLSAIEGWTVGVQAPACVTCWCGGVWQWV